MAALGKVRCFEADYLLANATGHEAAISHTPYATIMNLFCQPMSSSGLERSTGCDVNPRTTTDPTNESNPAHASIVARHSGLRDAVQAGL